jgi:cellulose biosynthesis protein BcsQ
MLVIGVALLKGGVSKTTTAVALAEVAAPSVPTVAIHTDPTGSLNALTWQIATQE